MAAVLDLPAIYLLPTHLNAERLHELKEKIPTLTHKIHEAEIIVGNITKRERALFELRRLKVHTDPVEVQCISDRKRNWDSASSGSDSAPDACDEATLDQARSSRLIGATQTPTHSDTVRVVRLDWIVECLKQGEVPPLQEYLIYEGHKKEAPQPPAAVRGRRILSHAAADTTSCQKASPKSRISASPSADNQLVPELVRQTTSEHDSALEVPPVPPFLRTTYACQRATPVNPPNAAFIDQLKKIRTTRRLIGDQIGVRAYSTSIATISAYPYVISSSREIARLPGCGTKIAELWHQWKEAGRLREVDEAHADPKLSVTQAFYDIWGVGDAMAREFYNKGWRDLDDVVEYGWQNLTRVQQIGVKFYDEFKLKIPRAEVESIADTILKHAREFSPKFELLIVGSYRRGRHGSGDVDVIISHPDESATLSFVEKLVVSLEKSMHVTHTLTLSNHNSERGQQQLSWKRNGGKGNGFDTLDKALVVWQEPATKEVTGEGGERPHRRVDIIVSPWKTVGCAVLGWSGDTTFQRDLRRYCKEQKNLKFDSSGIRRLLDGSWVDFEGGKFGKAPDMLAAERRVFDGLGLDWICPEDRCTG